MREIKFRAWNKEKNIMVYDNEDDTFGYWDGCRNSIVGMVNSILNKEEYFSRYDFVQYTGLKDKNGVEIYEGDIVKIIVELISGEKIENETEEYIGAVTYDADDTRYKIITSKDYEFTLSLEDDLEVIGNIYENKELLEGE